ncbi:sulfotransferase family protein [Jannaschia ovalis]|uniref:Sulfotransferase n=1 Tax=Jannaschia ovalis TaxID=3038773 RepID=A0ABY8LEC0_9RHOB|nr:sulfotransferase [Jannaschia sp. GRR-S6-38]WGH79642.1 sulfotransferase [Jannaschia sp. GRR-S6-38]
MMHLGPIDSRFDIHGPRSAGDRLKRAIRRAYAWPQVLFTPPLETGDVLPIFVVGCGNSGTSLLAAALGRAEELMLMGYESGAFFPEKGLGTGREVAQAWLAITQQTGCRGFIEKTPKHVHCLNRIRRIIPKARFVAVVRDGRDVVASFKARGLTTEFAIRRWCVDNEAILRERGAADVLVTRYEDIVGAPEAELRRICEALGVEYHDDMIHGSGSGYAWITERKTMGVRAKQTAKPIYDNRGKWKTALSDAEVALFRRKAGPLMDALGYTD